MDPDKPPFFLDICFHIVRTLYAIGVASGGVPVGGSGHDRGVALMRFELPGS